MHEDRMLSTPSVSIGATGSGLRWKVVRDGETIGTGSARSMEEAQAAADDLIARIAKTSIAGS